jgi:hypothetical protein
MRTHILIQQYSGNNFLAELLAVAGDSAELLAGPGDPAELLAVAGDVAELLAVPGDPAELVELSKNQWKNGIEVYTMTVP